jgi:hypothetical protein
MQSGSHPEHKRASRELGPLAEGAGQQRKRQGDAEQHRDRSATEGSEVDPRSDVAE